MTTATAPGGARRQPWRAVVVDDQALLVSAFDMLLASQADMDVAGTAGNGAAALDLLRSLLRTGTPADVVLMDIRMPVMDGIAAIRALRADAGLHATPVLVLTTFDDEELVLAALRAGANGFLLKDASPRELLEAVRTVADGGAWLDPAITATVLAHLGEETAPGRAGTGVGTAAGPVHDDAGSPAGQVARHAATDPRGAVAPRPDALLEPLTARERDVLELVCEGLPNVEIGRRLHLAESTVKTHVRSLLLKTGQRNRVELIVHAFRNRLVTPDR